MLAIMANRWDADNLRRSKLEIHAVCAQCGSTFERPRIKGRPSHFCSVTCRRRAKRRYEYQHRSPAEKRLNNHRRRARHYGVEYEPITIDQVMVHDQWMCGICHDPIDPLLPWPDPMSKSVDHIIPMSRGGGHIWSNVQAAHLGCNTAKGSLTLDSK